MKRRLSQTQTVPNKRAKFSQTSKSKAPLVRSVEKKSSDSAVVNTQANTTPSITPICIPQIGGDISNRVGRRINIQSVYLRGFVNIEAAMQSPPAVAVVPSQLVRLIIFVDNQANGTAVVASDVLNQLNPASHLNLANRDRFRILKDKQWVLDPYERGTTAGSVVSQWGRTCHPFKIFKKLDIECTFNASSTGGIADISTGALYMMWIGSNPPGTNTDAQVQLAWRVRYTDY